MLDPTGRSIGRGVEIGVDHASRIAELQLDAVAFANLERGIAEAADQLRRAEADEGSGLAHDRRRDDRWRGCRLRFRGRGAGSEDDGRSKDGGYGKYGATHPRVMPAGQRPRKVAMPGNGG